jgi:hypothetical protein
VRRDSFVGEIVPREERAGLHAKETAQACEQCPVDALHGSRFEVADTSASSAKC